jgi:hypothetical protein
VGDHPYRRLCQTGKVAAPIDEPRDLDTISGGQSLLRDTVTAGGVQSVMVLHAYDGESGDPFVNLVNLTWTSDGWPELS